MTGNCEFCASGIVLVEVERHVFVAEIAHDIGCTRPREDQ